MTDARRGFERRDGVCGAALHQNSAAENVQCASIARVDPQYLGGNTFCLAGALAVQGERGLLQGGADVGIRHGRSWSIRHCCLSGALGVPNASTLLIGKSSGSHIIPAC